MARFLLTAPGPRPPHYTVAEHLWGSGCDFDSDGNSDDPEATDWTELTVTLRAAGWEQDNDEAERVDIDPIGTGQPLILGIVSENAELARRAAEYLHQQAGGELTMG